MDRTFKRKRGYFTFAQNGKTDYLRLAYGLALSLRATQKEVPYLSVAITPGMAVPDKYRAVFDEVIDIPWGDAADTSDWKLENEWKAYHITPYEETIKLDADMLFLTNLDWCWQAFLWHDFLACNRVKTYRGTDISNDYYRKTFTANKLPTVYTALMYFKYSDLALQVYTMAEIIFKNWQKFRFEFMQEPRPHELSTDVVFALALKLISAPEQCTAHWGFPYFVHMKANVQEWQGQFSENWMEHIDSYFTPDLVLKIGRYRQSGPFHYHVKEFLSDAIIGHYEKWLGL